MQVHMYQCYMLMISWFPFALDAIRLETSFFNDRSGEFGLFQARAVDTGNSHRLTARLYWNLRTHRPSPHSLYCASLCFKVRRERPWNTEIPNCSSILKFFVFQGFVVIQMKLNSGASRVMQVIIDSHNRKNRCSFLNETPTFATDSFEGVCVYYNAWSVHCVDYFGVLTKM